jgi:hypothetical protein
MAETSPKQWSDEQLVVKVGQKTFVVPSNVLENYRNEKLEGMGQKDFDEFFNTFSNQAVPAVYVRVFVAGDGDFIPPRAKGAAGKRGPSQTRIAGAKKGR